MQAFIGGDKSWVKEHAAEAVLDEFRISDVVRYGDDFVPSRREFEIDVYTRALFHFENECDGVHDSDDRFVRGHLGCELSVQEQWSNSLKPGERIIEPTFKSKTSSCWSYLIAPARQ